MATRKTAHPIEADEVSRVFDDASMERLACLSRLPATADRQRFADSVREAARIYAVDARSVTVRDQRTEISALLRAAERGQYERVASLIEKVSPATRASLRARAKRPAFAKPGLGLPAPEVLRDPATRTDACAAVARLCRAGGRYIAGRRRPSGRQSVSWEPLLHAPQSLERPPKREAERRFVMHLQLAWTEATGDTPSLAANPNRPGPFVRMVQECLKLVGAGHSDASGMINKLNRRRKMLKR
jgi:hypothetical protein